MSFRISSHKKNGQRIESFLAESGKAVIANSDSADLFSPIPDKATITLSEENGSLKMEVKGTEVSYRRKTLKDSSEVVGSSLQFTCGENEYYATVVLSGEPTARKKSYLSTIALTLIWSLLAVMIIVPIWLPYKITTHQVKGRNVLMENCSKGLDDLRRKVKNARSGIASLSQVHRDIIVRLNEEVEQIAWVYRHGGELMTRDELIALEQHIDSYFKVLEKVKKTNAVVVKPLSTNEAVKTLINQSK